MHVDYKMNSVNKFKWILLLSFFLVEFQLSIAYLSQQTGKAEDIEYQNNQKASQVKADITYIEWNKNERPENNFTCPHHCTCKKALFEVVCNNARLTKLPENLPPTTQRLTLKKNLFTVLSDSMFKHFPDICRLAFNWNNITNIGRETFTFLTNLTFLDLSSNPTSSSVLVNSVFCTLPYTSIQRLILTHMSQAFQLKADTLQCLENTSIQALDLSFNKHFCSLSNGTFCALKQLWDFSFTFNQCNEFNAFSFDMGSSLQKLRLGYNQLTHFPVLFINENSDTLPIFPNLTFLDLTGNRIDNLYRQSVYGLVNLQKLTLTGNSIMSISNNVIGTMKSLTHLFLDNNKIKYIDSQGMASDTLAFIQLEYNSFSLGRKHISIFRKLPQIKEIYLGQNDFHNVFTQDHIFQNLSTLTTLSLVGMKRLVTLSPMTFRGLYNLTTLFLTKNSIQHINYDMFSDLLSLQRLYLDANKLININQTSLPKKFSRTLKEINLASNPWNCNCDILYFKDWLNSTNITVKSLHDSHNVYKCATPNDKVNQPILKTDISDKICLTKPNTRYIIAVVSSLFLCLLTSTFSALCRYKWYFKSWLFELSVWFTILRKPTTQTDTNNKKYHFHAFVSYNSIDSPWVRKQLLVELEKRSEPPYHLCLFERNWLVGHDILDCVDESIAISRKTLLIVTNAFAQSQWCQLELTMAQHHLLEEGKNQLILALMEDIHPDNMTPRLALEMKRRTYLEWTEDDVGQKLFWQKLKHSLDGSNVDVRREMPQRDEINL